MAEMFVCHLRFSVLQWGKVFRGLFNRRMKDGLRGL